MPSIWRFVLLLTASNVFMTFAWYAHLRGHRGSPLWIVVLASWGLAFFEYCLQVPANRAGAEALGLGQMKVAQEIITLAVFAPFAVLYMGQTLKWDYLWAGFCLVGAAYFIFRA